MNNPTEQSAFNLEPGAAERDRAIEQVTAHAEAGFIAAARVALERCCFTMETFTTDEIWALIPEGIDPHEPRAMAAIMRFAESNNWAYPLDQYRPSSRPKAHRGPKRVWRSRVYPIRDALQPSYEEAEREPVSQNAMSICEHDFFNIGGCLAKCVKCNEYEEQGQEPDAVNRFERFRKELSPQMYRELYRDIPVECIHSRVINQNGILYCRDCSKTLV